MGMIKPPLKCVTLDEVNTIMLGLFSPNASNKTVCNVK